MKNKVYRNVGLQVDETHIIQPARFKLAGNNLEIGILKTNEKEFGNSLASRQSRIDSIMTGR